MDDRQMDGWTDRWSERSQDLALELTLFASSMLRLVMMKKLALSSVETSIHINVF